MCPVLTGGLPYTALRDAIFTHPTTAEGLIGLFSQPLIDPEQDRVKDFASAAT